MYRLINKHDRAIGSEAGMVQPGAGVDIDLTDEQLKAWRACGYADIQHIGDIIGPGSGTDSDADAAGPAEGPLLRDDAVSPAFIERRSRKSGKKQPGHTGTRRSTDKG